MLLLLFVLPDLLLILYPYLFLIVSSFYCVVFCDFFFFFKQKTAYEMRIIDWSSDVCSSDLIDMVTRDLQVHRFAPICLYGFLDVQRIPAGQASGFRSCEGGMPRPSRYLATVLLATCMPSFKSSSDSVASDSGRDAFSPVIMCLIMAWIAVAEQTPPLDRKSTRLNSS